MSRRIQISRNRSISHYVGVYVGRFRDIFSEELFCLRIPPNLLTILGVLCTMFAFYFLVGGAGDRIGRKNRTEMPAYVNESISSDISASMAGIYAGVLIFIAGMFDIMDGAVARRANRVSRLGAFLDSCFDRISDGLIFLGIMIYYLQHREIRYAHWYAILSVTALFHAELISYVKARAENFIPDCRVGYWQRGERIGAVLVGLFCGHIETAVAVLAIFPFFTVMRRVVFAVRQITGASHRGLSVSFRETDPSKDIPLKYFIRGSWGYDLMTIINLVLIIFIDIRVFHVFG